MTTKEIANTLENILNTKKIEGELRTRNEIIIKTLREYDNFKDTLRGLLDETAKVANGPASNVLTKQYNVGVNHGVYKVCTLILDEFKDDEK